MVAMRRRVLALAAVLGALVAWAGLAPAGASNDPGFPGQWNLLQIGAPAAWARTTGTVRVGVVDTGIDAGHEDIGAGRVVAFADCVGQPCASAAPFDDEGHGTHVSGIVGATKDNGKGVAGVAPTVQFVVAKALDKNGSGNVDDVNAGIHWVVDHGAQVVNLSLGSDPSNPVSVVAGFFGDTSLSDGVEYAWSHGAVAVLAAGNSNLVGVFGSSNYGSAHAVIVGATNPEGQVAYYSSPLGNAQWGVVAPGGEDTNTDDCSDTAQRGRCVLSTWPGNNYAWAQGTSMATPHVTATLALLRSEGLSANDAVQRLLATLAKVPCGSGCQGRVDAAAAVGLAPTPPPAVSQKGSGTPVPGTVVTPGRRTPPATTRRAQATTGPTASPTSTAPTSVVPAGEGGSVQEAARPPAQVKTRNSGGGDGRIAQVAIAIALLGGSAIGLGALARALRAGAAS